LGLELRDVVQGVSDREFYSPGSLLNVLLDTRHPFARGLPPKVAIWSEDSPAWRVTRKDFHSVANYPDSGILASGWLLGEKRLAEQSALVHVQLGRGSMVLFGMRPQYRAQSYQSFKLLFNAIVEK
jgi:hypothetical protein